MDYIVTVIKSESISSLYVFFFSSRRRHTRCSRDWSSDVCSSDLRRAGSLHPARLAAELHHVELEADLIPRHHRTAELHVIERHEVHDLVRRVLALEMTHQQHPADLRHRFDDEHARHDRMTREMPLKERH